MRRVKALRACRPMTGRPLPRRSPPWHFACPPLDARHSPAPAARTRLDARAQRMPRRRRPRRLPRAVRRRRPRSRTRTRRYQARRTLVERASPPARRPTAACPRSSSPSRAPRRRAAGGRAARADPAQLRGRRCSTSCGALDAAETLFEAARRLDPRPRARRAQPRRDRAAAAAGGAAPPLPRAVALRADGARRARASACADAAPAPPTGLRLSLCMIVKDEEEMLPRCLAAAAPAVDEIVDRRHRLERPHGRDRARVRRDA